MSILDMQSMEPREGTEESCNSIFSKCCPCGSFLSLLCELL
jgi:hypothetical protein